MFSNPPRGCLFPLLLTLPLLAGACSETGLRSLGDLPPLSGDPPQAGEEVPPPDEDLAPQIQITEPVLHAVYSTDFPLILRAQVADSEDPVEDLLVDWELLASGELLAGGLVPTSAGEVMAAAWLEEGGHALLATVTDRAGQTASDIVSFQVDDPEVTTDEPENTPPSAPGVSILPASPMTGDDLFCWVSIPSTDEDGDTISYSYQWLLDGLLTGDAVATVPSGDTAIGDSWTCEVTPNDGQDDGEVGSATVLVGSSGCEVTVTLDIDGLVVFTDSYEPATLPPFLWLRAMLRARSSWTNSESEIDNFLVEDLDAGAVLRSDSFDSSSDWYLSRGCHGSVDISDGVGDGDSDWNNFAYKYIAFPNLVSTRFSWDIYFGGNTGQIIIYVFDSAPTSTCSGTCLGSPSCPSTWLTTKHCLTGSWVNCPNEPGVGFDGHNSGGWHFSSLDPTLLAVGWHNLGVALEFSAACGGP